MMMVMLLGIITSAILLPIGCFGQIGRVQVSRAEGCEFKLRIKPMTCKFYPSIVLSITRIW